MYNKDTQFNEMNRLIVELEKENKALREKVEELEAAQYVSETPKDAILGVKDD